MNTKTIITELKQILTSNVVLEGCSYKSNNARELNQIYKAYFNGASRVVTEVYAFIEMLEGVNFTDELPAIQEALPTPDVDDIKEEREKFLPIYAGVVDPLRLYSVSQAALVTGLNATAIYTAIRNKLIEFICTNSIGNMAKYYIPGSVLLKCKSELVYLQNNGLKHCLLK